MDKRLGIYVSTSLSRLRSVPFLDGREQFWNAKSTRTLSANSGSDTSVDMRYIFHVSFCGSTLLASLLDKQSSVLALKEPHALVDISDWANGLGGDSTAVVSRAIRSFEEALLEPPVNREVVVLKPSNWANNLIRHICEPEAGRRAVFVTMPRYEFIKAVFRGGRDRMAYTARVTAHLSFSSREHRELLQAAILESSDPLDQIGRMAALVHAIQERTFVEAARRNGWDDSHWLTLDQITRFPLQAVLQAADALDIQVDAAEVERRVRARSAKHSKAPNTLFSVEQRATEDQDVEYYHGDRLRRADEWSRSLAL